MDTDTCNGGTHIVTDPPGPGDESFNCEVWIDIETQPRSFRNVVRQPQLDEQEPGDRSPAPVSIQRMKLRPT